MKLWKKTCAPLLIAGLCAPALINCDAFNKVASAAGAGCPAMDDGNFDALKLQGDAKVQGELKGFLKAVYGLKTLSVDMEKDLIASCGELGKALKLDDAALKAEADGGEGAKKVCGAVADKIKAMIDASGGATIKVDIGEPRCEVDVDAMLDCYKGCGSPVNPGQLEASCEGGKISGECSGQCKGDCTITGPAAKCSGACDATCDGKCDGKASKGKACDGKCDGKCSGNCTMTAPKGKCDGDCSGGCSAEIKAPKCSGTFKPPSVDLSCQMSCASKAASMVKCIPPSVKVTLDGKAKTDLTDLVQALQVTLPKIAKIQLGVAKRAVEQGKALVEYAPHLKDMVTGTGMVGIGCLATATGVTGKMTAAFKANIDVSVNLSASVGGSASAKTN